MFGRKKNNKTYENFKETVNQLSNIDLNNNSTGKELDEDRDETPKQILLRKLCNQTNAISIQQDETKYSMDIPYLAAAAIAKSVRELPVKNFTINADNVYFSVNNKKKDHIIYNNPNGIFNVSFKHKISKPSNLNIIDSTTSLFIPVRPFIKESDSSNDNWFVLNLSVNVSISYVVTEPVNLVEVKNICLFAAKAIMERSMNSDIAKELMGDNPTLPNIFPNSIADVVLLATTETSTFECKYSNEDSYIDKILCN